MKINDSNLQGVSTNGTGSAHDVRKLDRSGKSFSAGSSAGDITKDRFEFSGALGQLSRSMAQSDAGRASLVDALAAQYQSGQYHTDSAATSRAMIKDALSAGA